MSKEEVQVLLAAIATEIDMMMFLEKRGLSLGSQLSALFALREKVKTLELPAKE